MSAARKPTRASRVLCSPHSRSFFPSGLFPDAFPRLPPRFPRSVMLVGLGGNNGTTLLAGVLANKQ